MSLIHAISRYISNGDINLDPTRKSKNDICSKGVRTIKVASYCILGIGLSPTSIVLGAATSIAFLMISIKEHVNTYLSKNQASISILILRSLCALFIETPCVALVLTGAFFVDIVSCFLQELAYGVAEMNNYATATNFLNNTSSSIDKLFYKKRCIE